MRIESQLLAYKLHYTQRRTKKLAKISPAKRIRNMINGLEEIEVEYRARRQAGEGGRVLTGSFTTVYLDELRKAKQALEKLWKSSVG